MQYAVHGVAGSSKVTVIVFNTRDIQNKRGKNREQNFIVIHSDAHQQQ